MPPSPTQLGKLALGTADPVTMQVNHRDFNPGVRYEFADTHGTTGSYDKDDNRLIPRSKRVAPRLTTEPTPAELAFYLAWGMWGTPTGAGTVTYPLGDTAAERTAFWNAKNGDQFFFPSLAVNRMELRAAAGGALTCTLDLLGKDVDDTRSDYPGGLTIDQTGRAWVMSQLVLSVAGVTRPCREFVFSVDHNVDADRFLNSLTLTDYLKRDQRVGCSIDVPAGGAAQLWRQGRDAGFAVLATFTNGFGGVLSLSLGSYRPAPASPEWPNRAEGYVRLDGEATRTGTNRPATVTLNVGP